MSPTALGALASNKPIPHQRCQIAVGTGQNANHWQAGDAGVPMPSMSISYQPLLACWWIVRANQILTGVNGGWQRADLAISLSPADADGFALSRIVSDCYDAGTVGWRAYSGIAAFRLAAGTLYTATLVFYYSSGGIQQSYDSFEYARLLGVVHGEGVV